MSQLSIVGNGNQGGLVYKCKPCIQQAGLRLFWYVSLVKLRITTIKAALNIKPAGNFLKIQIAVLASGILAVYNYSMYTLLGMYI